MSPASTAAPREVTEPARALLPTVEHQATLDGAAWRSPANPNRQPDIGRVHRPPWDSREPDPLRPLVIFPGRAATG